jgi:hypothetical protein
LQNKSFNQPIKINGTLFDPCAGWGGRLLGTVAAGWNYVACEPNKETFDNLTRLIEFLDVQDKVRIHNIPVEEFHFSSLTAVDVVLTSPPYFNLEVYTSENNQSYNKYSDYTKWRDCWLFPLIEQCLNWKPRISAWNVMNMGKLDLVNDVHQIHMDNGYLIKSTVGFQSPLNNMRTLKNKDVTHIFVSKRPCDAI